MVRTAILSLALCFGLAIPRHADAYRPFDATDAAVAAPGEFELELGPLGYLSEGPDHFLIAPSTVLNFGIGRNIELVLAGRHAIQIAGLIDRSRFRVLETGLFLKTVLREGSLQGRRGPSLAMEFGPLLPPPYGQPGWGGRRNWIGSQACIGLPCPAQPPMP